MSNDKPEDRTEEEEEAPDPSFKPVEGFLRNEALSRFPIQEVPVHLFDWKPIAERLTSTAHFTDEEQSEYRKRRTRAAFLSEESSDEALEIRKERRKTMVTELWDQLSGFYDREGYEALHAMLESLEKRGNREESRIAKKIDQVEYRAFLEKVVSDRADHHGGKQPIKLALEDPNMEEGVAWNVPDDRPDHVRLEATTDCLEKRGIDEESLNDHPLLLEENATWEKELEKVRTAVRRAKRKVWEWIDTLHLIRLRRKLARRKLWLIDMGMSHLQPPEPYTVPSKLRDKDRALKYCLMVLSVLDAIEKQWPSQAELGAILDAKYDLKDRGLRPGSVVSQAASFIRDRAPFYQDFGPDFYHRLKMESDFLRFVADELELDVPKPDGHEDQA